MIPDIPQNLPWAWPVSLLIFGLTALFLFRAPISGALNRVRAIGKDGASFGEAKQDGAAASQPLALIEMFSQPTYASVLAREGYLKNQLKTLNYGSEPEQIAALLRALAYSHVLHQFDVIAHNIYGSQVRFLVHLSSSSLPIKTEEAEEQFKLAQEQFNTLHGDKTLDAWLKYPSVRGLIENKDGYIDITQEGKDFLKHLVDSRIAYDRYG